MNCPTPKSNDRCGCRGHCHRCGFRKHTVVHVDGREPELVPPEYVHAFDDGKTDQTTGGKVQ